MPDFLNYTGLINILFFFVMITVLFYWSDKINLKKHTISNLADDKKTAFLFNLTLFIFTLGQVVFSFIVVYNITGKIVSFPMILFLIGGVFLGLACIYTTKNNPRRHQLAAGLSALFVGLGVVILSLYLLSENISLGYIMIAASILVPLSYLFRNKLKGAYWEIILFGGVALWNVVFSLTLIK